MINIGFIVQHLKFDMLNVSIKGSFSLEHMVQYEVMYGARVCID